MKREVRKVVDGLLERFDLCVMKRSERELDAKNAFDAVKIAAALCDALDVIGAMDPAGSAHGAVEVARWAASRSRRTLRRLKERPRSPLAK